MSRVLAIMLVAAFACGLAGNATAMPEIEHWTTANGARVYFVAAPEIPMIEFFGRGGALKPSWYGDCLPSRDFPMLIDLYLQGRLDLDRFVSETIDLDQVEEAFHKMERGEVLRSVVVL